MRTTQQTAEANILLSVRDLQVSYGRIEAVKGISFDVRRGEIVSLIGANGAGKSSTLAAISGAVPYRGSIVFKGRELNGLPPEKIAASGVVHVPEGRGIFGNLTVNENMLLASWTRRNRRQVRQTFALCFDLFPRLAERRHQYAGTLSGGEQQMLAIARALIAEAELLLLDEPSMGLAPVLVNEIVKTLREANTSGLSILLVEQNVALALQMASRTYLLETGSLVLSGPTRELIDHPRIKQAYLGG